MAKYSYELKREIVERYLNCEGGYRSLAVEYSIPQSDTVRKWVKAYEMLGYDGLKRVTNKRVYSLDFMLHVVELYLTGKHTYYELAKMVGVPNVSTLITWVHKYEIAGIDGLIPKKKGRKPNMNELKSMNKPNDKSDYLKALEEENLKLKVENAFLKELRRLRLEKERQKKKRE